jgi:polyisoprenoid-binding protein YceI
LITKILIATCIGIVATSVLAAPEVFQFDPSHTYPSFEADHLHGLSVWRGKFTRANGTANIDPEAKTGSVEVAIDLSSIQTGNSALDAHLRGHDFFDVGRFPTAVYKGAVVKFEGGKPVELMGTLNLHGVTKPLALAIGTFKCIWNPLIKHEVCGADASAVFNRADYGLLLGQNYGFDMQIKLQIQVEAIKQ